MPALNTANIINVYKILFVLLPWLAPRLSKAVMVASDLTALVCAAFWVNNQFDLTAFLDVLQTFCPTRNNEDEDSTTQKADGDKGDTPMSPESRPVEETKAR